MSKNRILFVDDDPQMLEFYKLLGQFLGKNYDPYTAAGGAEALSFMAKVPMDIVVSDLAMPEMNGCEFLSQVVTQFPGSIRIVASGHADQASVVESLMFGHRYFQKPFLLATFATTLKRICHLKHLVGSEKIRRVVCGPGALPTPPDTYFRLSEALDSPESGIEDIAQIVIEDPGLTGKILQIVNSAEFGSARRINTPAEAVQLIGAEILRALMLSIRAFKFYEYKTPQSLSVTQLWNNSIRTAVAAQKLARFEKLSFDESQAAFVAGLLLDIGKLILAANADSEYGIAIARSRKEGLALETVEQEVFGATHAHVGAFLLGLWGLPDVVIETVEAQHSFPTVASQGFSIAAAVHIAECLQPPSDHTAPLDREHFKKIGLEGKIEVWQQVLAA